MLHQWKSGGRTLLLAAVAVAAALPASRAEKLDAPQWHFSVNFPCQSQIGGQTAKTEAGDIVITTYTCGDDTVAYVIAISDFPAGLIKPETIDNMYAGAVNTAAADSKGTIRSIMPYTLANYTGREALIDVIADKTVMHMRNFIVGNRFYQVLYLGPAGSEQSKECLEFLNSFTFIATNELAKPISPPAK